eukprot:3262116-Lingulodinium_polyedra.AAC.1
MMHTRSVSQLQWSLPLWHSWPRAGFCNISRTEKKMHAPSRTPNREFSAKLGRAGANCAPRYVD